MLIFEKPLYASGMIDLSTGISTDYRYFKRDDNATYKDTQQLDRLYIAGELSRDFYLRRLGDLYIKFDLSKYNLNRLENKYFSPTIPFLDNKENNDNYFLHNIKSKLSLNIPKVDLKILAEYEENTKFSVDNSNFKKIGKITDDIEDLKGTIKSLDDRDLQRSQNYFIAREGKINTMINYNRYEYEKKFETSNYMKLEDIFKYGIDINKIAGILVEKNVKKFKNDEKNETIKKYKIGLIDYFGSETTYKLNKLNLKGYYSFVENEYKESIFKDRYGVLGTDYEIDSNRNLNLDYEYIYKKDKYTNELKESNLLKASYAFSSTDYSYYLKYKKTNVESFYENIDNSSYTYDEANSVLSNTVEGPGKLIIKSVGNNLINLNMTVDGTNINQNVSVTPSSSHTVIFERNITGSITNILGDKNDLTILIYIDRGYDKKQKKNRLEIGYYYKKLEYIRSKFDMAYEYVSVDKGNTSNNSYIYNDQQIFDLKKLFEIRPINFIFDKSFNYKKINEGPDKYTNIELSSSDGYFDKNFKFYLLSNYFDMDGEGVYDDIRRFDESIVFDYFSESVSFFLKPTIGSENAPGKSKKKLFYIDNKLRYFNNNLNINYKKENINKPLENDETNIYKNINYRLTLSNYSFNFDYVYNKTNNIFEEYSPSFTYIIYKIFPRNDPYLIIDFGLRFGKSEGTNYNNGERYYFAKTTYRPTSRLELILAYERASLDNGNQKDIGNDYEFILRFKTKVFKLSIGYRNNNVLYNNQRRDENVVYLQIDKSFNYNARVK